MKSVKILIGLLVLATTAFGQKANPRLCQLDEYFKKQGIYSVSYHQTNAGGISHSWWIHFSPGLLTINDEMDQEMLQRMKSKVDSVDALCRQRQPSIIDTIRSICASVRKDASESYMYEYHKDGADTVRYTLAFCRDDGSNRESVLFESRNAKTVQDGTPQFEGIAGASEYYHEYIEPRSVPNSDMKLLDVAAVRAIVEPALESVKQFKGAKAWPIHWQHDATFEDQTDTDPFGGVIAGRGRAGLTTGIHYLLPAQYENEGDALYLQIDSLAHDYVDRHPEQEYVYAYFAAVPNLYKLRFILRTTEYGSPEEAYHLGYYRDKEGLHFLSVTTKGQLRIPQGWTKIKRRVNGKATFRKN